MWNFKTLPGDSDGASLGGYMLRTRAEGFIHLTLSAIDLGNSATKINNTFSLSKKILFDRDNNYLGY